MEILIFSQYFWPENFHINDLARNLKKFGNDVTVLTGKPNYPDGKVKEGYRVFGFQKENWNDIKIYRVPILMRGNSNSLNLILNYFSYIFSALLFSPFILRKHTPSIILVYGVSPIFQVIPALFLGRIKKIPVVLWVQDLWPESIQANGFINSSFLLNLIDFFVRFCYKHVDSVLVQSKGFIPNLSKKIKSKKIIYFPNSVSHLFYKSSDVKVSPIKSLNSGFTVLFAGNIGIAQSIKTIISAAKFIEKYPKIKIIIMGSGSQLNFLKIRIAEDRISNIFLEKRQPIELMPKILKKASVLLVSLNDDPILNLTVPNKLQAYLAVGKPIIACLNGEGASITSKSRAGIVCRAEDPEGLAASIIRLYNMTKKERDLLGRNGRNYFNKYFNQDILTFFLIRHLKTLIKRKK
jgi:glycosyltransferase involved in cell wall biosynthesis